MATTPDLTGGYSCAAVGAVARVARDLPGPEWRWFGAGERPLEASVFVQFVPVAKRVLVPEVLDLLVAGVVN